MSEEVTMERLMAESGVKFGTSGARGLVSAMTDRFCFAVTTGFLLALRQGGELPPGSSVAIGGDCRPSTPRILTAVAAAISEMGCTVDHCGALPSPALALRGMERRCATVMVTGSHIPADRNGMKFTTAAGEVTKQDEQAIVAQSFVLKDLFDDAGALRDAPALGEANRLAIAAYRNRYLQAFPESCLSGMRLGVYGHSAVGRDFFVDLYRALGAEVIELGFSEVFVPVDTEAIRPEDVELAAGWAADLNLDAIVSSDGDSDRPLTADEKGRWFRGDITGIIAAKWLTADAVAVPVSCNGALEECGSFARIQRTRIGSPFVIEGMQALTEPGKAVVGYEANGGFLHSTPLVIPGGSVIPALPTRDAVIVHLAVLLAAKSTGRKLSQLLEDLPSRFTASDRDQNFPTERSVGLVSELRSLPEENLSSVLELGPVIGRNETDGLRIQFATGEVLHYRPSGNAPELRCYSEASTEERAMQLVELGLEVARRVAPAA